MILRRVFGKISPVDRTATNTETRGVVLANIFSNVDLDTYGCYGSPPVVCSRSNGNDLSNFHSNGNDFSNHSNYSWESGIGNSSSDSINSMVPDSALEDGYQPTPRTLIPKRVLLVGRAGIGKTTICRKLALQWAQGTLWQNKFRALFFLNLSEYSEAELALPLAALILRKCFARDVPFSVQDVTTFLEEEAAKIGFIIDGLESFTEIAGSWRSPLGCFLMGLVPEYSLSSMFVASHPTGVEPRNLRGGIRPGNGVDIGFDLRFHVELEAVGFSQTTVTDFVQFYFKNTAPDASLTLIEKIRQDPGVRGLVYMPMTLAFLCLYFEERV